MAKQKYIQTKLSLKEFEQLFREYFKPLVYYSQKLVVDHDTAKDIVHNVFIKLWEKRESLDLTSSLKSYLFTSVYNRSLNSIRDNSKFYTGEIENVQKADYVNDPHDGMVEEEIEAKISETINALPDRCREVFILNRYEGLKYKEVASKLNISVKTVEIQISKALKILREELKDYLVVILFWLLYFISEL